MIEAIKRFFVPSRLDHHFEEMDRKIEEGKAVFEEAMATLDGESQWFVRNEIEKAKKRWELNQSEG